LRQARRNSALRIAKHRVRAAPGTVVGARLPSPALLHEARRGLAIGTEMSDSQCAPARASFSASLRNMPPILPPPFLDEACIRRRALDLAEFQPNTAP
jgi:hypothetical protein